jgi:hypothetical protein
MSRPENGLDSASEKSLSKVPKHPPPSKAVSRRDYLLKRLKVSKQDLALAPDIDAIVREHRGGKKLAIKALRFSEDPIAKAFLEKYDSLGDKDLQSLPITAIALAAGVDSRTLLGEIMMAIREVSVNSVKIIAMAAHPQITKKRVEYAQTPGGFRDRDKLDEMLGAIKAPAGSTFINKFFAAATNKMPEDEEQAEAMTDDLEYMFPDSSIMQEKVQPMRQKVLDAK